jgi:hypothetical protein
MSHAACSLSGPELAICERVQNLTSKDGGVDGADEDAPSGPSANLCPVFFKRRLA